ncbi:MAG TPA: biotin/lipoyl-binding protein [Bacillota bacterium]|jgi:biotin carboxyl carrier protein|nr:biotin/lipoyl-binding protein [Fastidiosipila sp.]HPX93233.1 biotin/lipoyl-binding protein [Bacillota bacterium]HQB81067.1 biotin/lipoyl-binding protein [Bacillota bacterium]
MSVKKFRVVVDGQAYLVEVEEIGEEAPEPLTSKNPRPAVPAPPAAPAAPAARADGQDLKAPLQGTVLELAVKAGQEVKAGQTLLIIEAMKMENEILAPGDAVIDRIHVSKGDVVAAGDPLISFSQES